MSKTSLLLLAALGAVVAACANPITAYHRQFEYSARTGAAALADGRLEDAYAHYDDAAELAQYAHAGDLELVRVLTRLGEVARRTGRIEEARGRMKTAGRVLVRYSEREGSGGWSYPKVAAAYALEDARLQASLGDLSRAEASLGRFFSARGRGGAASEVAEARWLRGELLLARGLAGPAREDFRLALEASRELGALAWEDGADEVAFLRASILLRAAEVEVEQGRLTAARDLVAETRPDDVGLPDLRAGMLLVLARIDVAERNADRARNRLEEAFETMETSPVRDVAAPARAALVGSLVFDAASEAALLQAAQDRSFSLAERTPPLGGVLLGRALVAAGRDWIAAGRRDHGLQVLEQGRDVIESALSGSAHVALVDADFAIAMAFEALGWPADASETCAQLRAMGADLEMTESEDSEHTRRVVACGRVDARTRHTVLAREAFVEALSRAEAAREEALQLELLIRLAALAHIEERAAVETKLFERALPLLTERGLSWLPELLADAYGALGADAAWAAARFELAAGATPGHADAAERLQAIAAALGESTTEGPASLR